MKEQAAILAEARRLQHAGASFALATVVKINGSAYRRPGARMLVAPGGTTVGTISGGCLEQEVAQQALQVIETSTPRVEAFDLGDDDLLLGFGIGCDGVVHVLIEPVTPAGPPDPLVLIERCLERRAPGVLATITDAPEDDALAQHLLLFEDGTTRGALSPATVRAAVEDDAAEALERRRSRIRQYPAEGGPVEVLFDVVEPPLHLLVFGDGHDVRPVVRIAKELGWRVTVVGRRTDDELADRFPTADAHVFLMNPEEMRAYVAIDARSPAVVMNHNYVRDKTLIGALLHTEIPYVGALGPRRRTERMVEALAAEHDTLTGADFDRLHGPVGLDLGTETPEEIALAITAEVQAVLHGRSAQKLREREGSIHREVRVA